jgi:hypothetical protein
MGWHSSSGSATRAPDIFFNHSGSPSWSNKKTKFLTAEDREEILEFAKTFACSQGERDGLSSRDVARWNLFHPDFLHGEPHQLFEKHYSLEYDVGRQTRLVRKLDEEEAAEEENRQLRWKRDMQDWGDHVQRTLAWALPCRSNCETLGRTRFERWLLSIVAERVLRRAKKRGPFLTKLASASLWRCSCFANRVLPRQWRYLPGRLSTTLRTRQATEYKLRAQYYASNAWSKQPRFFDLHQNLSRLEALAMTWYCSQQGAFKIEVAGYLQLPHYPYTAANEALLVERMGWTWSHLAHDEPYLAWPFG